MRPPARLSAQRRARRGAACVPASAAERIHPAPPRLTKQGHQRRWLVVERFDPAIRRSHGVGSEVAGTVGGFHSWKAHGRGPVDAEEGDGWPSFTRR